MGVTRVKKSKAINIAYIIFVFVSLCSQILLIHCNGSDTVCFSLYYILSGVTFTLLAFDDAMWSFCSFAAVSVTLNLICGSGNYFFYIITVLTAVLSILMIRALSAKLKLGSALSVIAAVLLRYALIHYLLLLFKPSDFPSGHYSLITKLFSTPALVSSLVVCISVVLLRPLITMLSKQIGDTNEIDDVQ